MEPSMVQSVAGIAALSLVLVALVSGLKVFLAHKGKVDIQTAQQLKHEETLIKIASKNSNMLIEAITILRRLDRHLNNK